MFRFTIRELVLLTLVVAMGVGWWFERRLEVERWKKEADARDEQFHCLLGQLEHAVPGAVTRQDGQITVSTGSVPITYPGRDLLRDQLSD